VSCFFLCAIFSAHSTNVRACLHYDCVMYCRCTKVMPPKYEDVLQMTEECEMSSAGVLVSPPPYRVNDADKSSDDN